MTPEVTVALMREGMMLLATVGGPLFAALAGIGLVVGILQATTQINDPAVGFLPRIAGALLACWFFGGWMVERLALFFAHALERMGSRPF